MQTAIPAFVLYTFNQIQLVLSTTVPRLSAEFTVRDFGIPAGRLTRGLGRYRKPTLTNYNEIPKIRHS